MNTLMKAMILGMLAVVCLGVYVMADDSDATANPTYGTQIGDLYYTFSGTDATVIGYSSSIDWSTFTTIPDTVTYNGVVYTVTTIDADAFLNCTNLALTSLPSGLTKIGQGAFYNCSSLALTSLPSGLNRIDTRGFYNCTNLALTSLPSGLTSINSYAFQNCTNLALTSLPSGLTTINTASFSGCTNLALTSLPSGLTSIADSAFAGCTSLALTSLPSGLTSISSYSFYNCTNLALTELPSGLTSIGSSAFEGCTSITRLVVDNENLAIGSSAFFGTGIDTIILLSDVASVQSNSFSNTPTDMQIFNLSGVDNDSVSIRPGNGGISANAVIQDYIDATSMLQQVEEVQHETIVVKKTGIVYDILGVLPIIMAVAILLGIVYYIKGREE